MKYLAPPAFVLVGLFILTAGLTGCEEWIDGQEQAPPPSTTEVAPSIRSYTVRGTLKTIEPTQLQVRHEAIPTFVDKDGTVVGMKAMTMPFPLGPGISTEGFAVDDAVMMTFDVDYTREGMPHQVTQLEHTTPPPTAPPTPAPPASTTQPATQPATTQPTTLPAAEHDHSAMQH